ncbi:cytochrome c [Leptolyngbya sp. FACHB-261]|uniref:c-type cytochrome n=1 Tax=Leptolyngbya sp. FACHB-261 TaxID=2692806 RepID=UPI001687836B|nr:cytochrome c [Leptolyngbya sp. FACHB-261]MBD2099365.1 cytochrome c [Leptolyngbya sp. FACHB-261]
MDSSVEPKTTPRRAKPWLLLLLIGVLITGLALLLSIQSWGTDPYTQLVLTLKGHPNQGRAIFEMNCAACHGVLADGKVGPSLRGVSERRSAPSIIHQVTSGSTPPMPQFQPDPQEMADLLSYLKSL